MSDEKKYKYYVVFNSEGGGGGSIFPILDEPLNTEAAIREFTEEIRRGLILEMAVPIGGNIQIPGMPNGGMQVARKHPDWVIITHIMPLEG